MKDSMDSTSGDSESIKGISHSSLSCRPESELRNDVCAVALVLSFDDALVKLDGGLKAPAKYRYQETIIKGDLKEQVIGLGSIMAKVTRDRYMEKEASKSAYTAYNFAKHKGYGTLEHRAAIKRFGPSDEHRLSFCGNTLGK